MNHEDQPLPTPGGPSVPQALFARLDVLASARAPMRGLEALRAAIEARTAIGIERYGTELCAHNGRDCIRDATEEALDLLQYAQQAHIEGLVPVAVVDDALRCALRWLAIQRDRAR